MTATLESFFSLAQRGTDVRTEVRAGVTTFLTMAYRVRLGLDTPGLQRGGVGGNGGLRGRRERSAGGRGRRLQ